MKLNTPLDVKAMSNPTAALGGMPGQPGMPPGAVPGVPGLLQGGTGSVPGLAPGSVPGAGYGMNNGF